jgi:hypothetical protein
MGGNNNPTGKGGLGARRHAIWRWDRGIRRCTAVSKRNHRRCRMPAMKGSMTCYWHGAPGGDHRKRILPTSMRHLRNLEIKRGRLVAVAEVERRMAANELHPETYNLFREMDRSRLHPADEGRLLLAIDTWLRGDMTAETWRETRKLLGLLPGREREPELQPEPRPETPEVQPIFGFRSPDGF